VRRGARAWVLLVCALTVVPPAYASTPVSLAEGEVALLELSDIPQSVNGRICLDPGREWAEDGLRSIARLARVEERRIALELYRDGCGRPGAVLRMHRPPQPDGCPVRIVAEWWVAGRQVSKPSVRVRRRYYESDTAPEMGRFRRMPDELRGSCTGLSAK
jgi:hypothetical protein